MDFFVCLSVSILIKSFEIVLMLQKITEMFEFKLFSETLLSRLFLCVFYLTLFCFLLKNFKETLFSYIFC